MSLLRRSPEPLFPNIGVIFVVPDGWESLPQPRHQVASRLGKYFRVLWMDGFRTETGRRLDLQNPDSDVADFPDANVTVQRVTPFDEALYFRLKNRGWATLLRVRAARRTLMKMGCDTICAYVWRPEFADVSRWARFDKLVYHVDDEYSFSEVDQPVSSSEAYLLNHADCVFVHSIGLLQKKGHYNDRTSFVPNGVDFAAYDETRPEPADMTPLPRPLIGYVGVIKQQLDFGLLSELARSRTDWSIVLVGPVGNLGRKEEEFSRFSELSNVHLLGRKPLNDLPAYTRHFDVCMMCYDVNDYTNYIYPLKLHEYLVSGSPVISTPIRTVLDFPQVVSIAADAEGWRRAIDSLLEVAARSPELIHRRKSIARMHDWNRIVARIAQRICGILGKSYVEKFADAATGEGLLLFDAAQLGAYADIE